MVKPYLTSSWARTHRTERAIMRSSSVRMTRTVVRMVDVDMTASVAALRDASNSIPRKPSCSQMRDRTGDGSEVYRAIELAGKVAAPLLRPPHQHSGGADAVNAAAGARQHVLCPLDYFVLFQDCPEGLKLHVTEFGAGGGRCANGAVILNQDE